MDTKTWTVRFRDPKAGNEWLYIGPIGDEPAGTAAITATTPLTTEAEARATIATCRELFPDVDFEAVAAALS